MKTFKYVVTDPVGIHARPAGELSKKAKEYASTIKIAKGDKDAAADRLMALMALGIKQGEEVTVTIEGADEDKAYTEMQEYFKANL